MSSNKPFIVGVAGGSGSGKTFFLKSFLTHFKPGEVCLVSQDDYYIPVAHTMTAEENKLYNFDLPATIDREHFFKDIESLVNGRAITKKEYTFNNANATPKTLVIQPAPILIIEGLFIMHFTEIKTLLNMRIFIEADEDIALQRRLKRDLMERGYSNDDVLYKWNNHVVPAYKEYLLPHRAKCDRLIINNSQLADEIVAVTEEISASLKKKVLAI